jgi:hypothetical protein
MPAMSRAVQRPSGPIERPYPVVSTGAHSTPTLSPRSNLFQDEFCQAPSLPCQPRRNRLRGVPGLPSSPVALTYLIVCHAPPHDGDGRRHPGAGPRVRVCLTCSETWTWCRGAGRGFHVVRRGEARHGLCEACWRTVLRAGRSPRSRPRSRQCGLQLAHHARGGVPRLCPQCRAAGWRWCTGWARGKGHVVHSEEIGRQNLCRACWRRYARRRRGSGAQE